MTIRIFSVSNCKQCSLAKDFFSQRGLTFKEIDVKQNLGNLRRMRRISDAGIVPVIQINNEVIVGFDEAGLKDILKKV